MGMVNPKSRFVKVKCQKCKNSQIIFGNASTRVRCLECDSILAEPSSGKAKMRSRVEEVL